MKSFFRRFRLWLSGLSFRTGVIVLSLCVPCYILSFAQMSLPSHIASVQTKAVLWTVLFGMAKTFQYGGLTILGKEGWLRVKAYWQRRKS